MSGKPEWVNAPFTPEQIVAINFYQEAGIFHPFTCPDRAHYGDDIMFATAEGVKCPTCSYVQDWVWSYMVDLEKLQGTVNQFHLWSTGKEEAG